MNEKTPRKMNMSKYGLFMLSLMAAHQSHSAVLEEVIVTAQLREQSLQDVPVSVSAIGADKMREAGLSKIEDLQAYVPNFTMSESGIGTDIFVRGIGSGENQGFEQSVGMYVDGISYGRAQLARAPFLDLARVEVLRGPQNILLGKNSIAGAINMSTVSPSQEEEYRVQVTYEPELNERIVDLILSAPINDELAVRFATRQRKLDGHIYNAILNRDEAQRDEATYRLKFLWEGWDALTAELKLEAGAFDVLGRQSEILTSAPSDSTTFLFTGKTYGEIMNNTVFPDVGAVGGLVGLLPPGILDIIQLQPNGSVLNLNEPDAVLDESVDGNRHSNGDFSNNKTQNITLKLDTERDGHMFTSITGYMGYEYDELCDCDFTGADVFQVQFHEEYQQFSQEFRWISPGAETIDYIGGAYFHYSNLDFFDSILVTSEIIPTLVNAADLLEGGGRGDIDPANGASSAFEVLGIGDAGNSLRGFRSPRDFNSESKVASAFLQATWNATDMLRVTLAGRFTYEEKEGSRRLEYAFADGTIRPAGEWDSAAAVSFGTERHSLKGSRTEAQFAPSLNIQWNINDDIMTYFAASKGFKSGGFDARSNATPDPAPTPNNPGAVTTNSRSLIGSFEYEEERATSYELGGKSTLFEGAAELNAALFRTEFEDLQVSVFDGTLGFNVGNAATAISQGLELDGRLALTESLMLQGGLAFLDFEFGDHLNGTCIQGQAPDQPNGVNCDFSGRTNQYVAEISGNILLAYETMFESGLLFRANIDTIFTDEYHPSPNLDDRIKQDAYAQFNGRLSLASEEDGWEIALLGKNLTDETIVVYGVDTPVAYTVTGATSHHGFIGAPRTFALQASYAF